MDIYSVNPHLKIGSAKTAQAVVNTLMKMKRAGHVYAFLSGELIGAGGVFSSEVSIEEAIPGFGQLRKELTNRSIMV